MDYKEITNEIIETLTGIPKDELRDSSRSLYELGIDSLDIIGIREHLQDEYGIEGGREECLHPDKRPTLQSIYDVAERYSSQVEWAS